MRAWASQDRVSPGAASIRETRFPDSCGICTSWANPARRRGRAEEYVLNYMAGVYYMEAGRRHTLRRRHLSLGLCREGKAISARFIGPHSEAIRKQIEDTVHLFSRSPGRITRCLEPDSERN